MAAVDITSHGAVSEASFAALQAEQKSQEEHADHLLADYALMVEAMRAVFDSGRTKAVSWRKQQLSALMRGIQENADAIAGAIGKDHGGAKMRAIFDMAPAIGDIEHALANIDQWSAPQTKRNDIPIDFQSTYTVRSEPKGVTLNIAPWNFPFGMCFQPLVGALAAGCCMIIKPSEMAPNCAEIIQRIIHNYLDTDCVKVIQGAIPETSALLAQHWDHIFYTGNGVVGKIVMEAAAKHLTPITLELGGKSPVLVDKTANIATVVNRIFAAKSTNQGQICVAPDYVLIDESCEEEFVREFAKQVNASGFGVGSRSNPNWGKIINERHAARLKNLIDTSGGEIVCGGSNDADVDAHHIPLTVIRNVDPNAAILREEIFGPVLPVMAVKNMDDALRFVKERERPLALYIFSQDKRFQERALSECTSGGAAVNTALEQLANVEAPFGGTGASGMGKYHGKFGFDEFSHVRTVLYKSGSNPTFPPVEKQPAWLYDVALKATVTGFVKPETKQKLKTASWGVAALGAAIAARSRL